MRETKTNVMRILESWHIPYQAHQYEARGPVDGVTVAEHLGISVQKVYKTLVTHDEKGQCYVFVIPCHKELDLKKAAAAVGVKSVSMLAVKDLQRLTGYIRGGCSPIGMKKKFPTFIDEAALNYETIAVSAGQRGFQVLLSPQALADYVGAKLLDLQQN